MRALLDLARALGPCPGSALQRDRHARHAALYRLRWPEDESVPQTWFLFPTVTLLSSTGRALTAWPASHIVGAAQLLIEYRGERIVYTGDIKLRPPICGAVTQIFAATA